MGVRTAYRIEHKDNPKLGAYSCYTWIRKGDEEHPEPRILKRRIKKRYGETDSTWFDKSMISSYFYGFSRKAHLKAWFDDAARKCLKESGYVIGVYKVDSENMVADRFQAAFYLQKATRVKTLDLEDL